MVSTLITSYNKGPYLAEAIESALAQDYEPKEILVIDDGSTDNTREVAARFGEQIRYHYQPNGGQASARNAGIRMARGEYVAFLDGDDRWRPGKLTRQVQLLEAHLSLAVVYARSATITPVSGWKPVERSTPGRLHRGKILDDLLIRNFIPFSGAVVRRDCLLAIGMFDEKRRYADDYDLWLRMAREYDFDYVDEVLSDYRHGISQITNSISATQYYHRALTIQRSFVEQFYGNKYPRPGVIRKATAAKYAELGDCLLGTGDHLGALAAHARAACADPLGPLGYVGILRDCLPNWLVHRARAVLRRKAK